MKTTLTILFLCILTFGSNGLSEGQGLTALEKSKIERQVDSVFLSMVKAAENVNYDIISLGVDDRYKAGFIINNSYYSEYDSMIDILKSNSLNGTKQTITFHNKKITILSEDIVLLTASGKADVDLGTGQSFNANFFWSLVYMKINNVWKVIQSHQSQGN
jgi:hypothetical protein